MGRTLTEQCRWNRVDSQWDERTLTELSLTILVEMEEQPMSPDVTARIIAKAWSDERFAQALQGPDACAAIQDALGVSLPAGTRLPKSPPAPTGATGSLRVRSAVRAGLSGPNDQFPGIKSYLCNKLCSPQ